MAPILKFSSNHGNYKGIVKHNCFILEGIRYIQQRSSRHHFKQQITEHKEFARKKGLSNGRRKIPLDGKKGSAPI
jgi:hypothetical protein